MKNAIPSISSLPNPFILVRTESYVHVGIVFAPNDCHAFIGVQEFITSAHDGAIIMANAET